MEKCVVWYTKTTVWKATKALEFDEAKKYAENLEANGYRTQIVERPKITVQDILEG